MRLALISPKGVGMGTNKENRKTAELYDKLNNISSLRELMLCPNSPLLTVAAIAQKDFEEIVYIDEEIEEIDYNEYFDIVAMSFMTQQASRAFELAKIFKEKRGSYVIAGGMHPTNSPEEAGKYFDTVFIGEVEVIWSNFMNDFLTGSPKKFYRNTFEIDMESVPVPMYSLLKMDSYKTIPIQISRGCPHDCNFCASTKVYGKKYRHKTIERVIEEIEIVKKLKQNANIYFTDDNMLVNKAFSSELLKRLADLNVRWMSHTDVGITDYDEILSLLYPSGCRKLVIGFESINPKSLEKLEKWKYIRINTYQDAIKKIQSYGVGVWGTFIVGLDDDHKDIFQRIVDFTLKNNLYGAMISVLTPFPGSKIFEQLESENRILTKHWGSYTLWNVVVEPKNMSVKELEEGFEYVLEQIYSKEAVAARLNYFKQIYANIRRNYT